MNKLIEYGKKLLTPFIVIILLIALNINTFAASMHSYTIDFSKQNFLAYNNGSVIDGVTVKGFDNPDYGHTTRYTFPRGITSSKMIVSGSPDLQLYLETQYSYEFYTYAPADYTLNLHFAFSNDENEIVKGVTLVDDNFSGDMWTKHSGTFYIDNIEDVTKYAFVFTILSSGTSGTESLVGFMFSVGDLHVDAVGPLYGGIVEPDNLDDLDGSFDRFDELVNSLPQIDRGQIDEIMNFDFNSFTAGMQFIRDFFDDTMARFNFSSVLAFSLTMGIACLLLGRKASGV